MMNVKNKGFIIVETIVTVVILSTSLLYLYSSYNTIINREETRLYYDDIAYLYRTNQIRTFLENNSNIGDVKRYGFDDTYIISIGPSYENMFTSEQTASNMQGSFEILFNTFNINQIILMDSTMLDDCDTDNDSLKCEASTEGLSYNMSSYITSLSDTTYDYYLVIEYAEKMVNGVVTKCIPRIDTNCHSYYTSLGI